MYAKHCCLSNVYVLRKCVLSILSFIYISRGFIFHLKLSYSPAYFRFCKTTYSQNAFLSDLKTKTANFKIGVGFVSRSVQNVRWRRRFITICHKTHHKFYLKILIAKTFRGWILEYFTNFSMYFVNKIFLWKLVFLAIFNSYIF